MKIAVSSTGNDLDSIVDPRFGRCTYFVIVDVENNEIKGFEAIENQGAAAMGGAGIQAAQIVANKGAKVVISGGIGPNSFRVLSQAGIKVVTGVGGISVKDAVERYLKGELKETSTPTTPSFGYGGMNLGRGGGQGRRRWQM